MLSSSNEQILLDYSDLFFHPVQNEFFGALIPKGIRNSTHVIETELNNSHEKTSTLRPVFQDNVNQKRT